MLAEFSYISIFHLLLLEKFHSSHFEEGRNYLMDGYGVAFGGFGWNSACIYTRVLFSPSTIIAKLVEILCLLPFYFRFISIFDLVIILNIFFFA